MWIPDHVDKLYKAFIRRFPDEKNLNIGIDSASTAMDTKVYNKVNAPM